MGKCWSCQGPVDARAPFCHTCGVIQPPGAVDHFTRLGMRPGFTIDQRDLEQRYFRFQQQLHPDRFATRSARERALSMQHATSLNEAYETLKSQVARAGYLLELGGHGVNAEGCNTVSDPVVLMEAMELREALAEAASAEETGTILDQARDRIAACLDALEAAFAAGDLDAAGKLTTRLRYLDKLAAEARERGLRFSAG